MVQSPDKSGDFTIRFRAPNIRKNDLVTSPPPDPLPRAGEGAMRLNPLGIAIL